MTARDKELLGLSATIYLLLGVWLGPNRALFVVLLAAIGFGWFRLCARYPKVAWITLSFVRGLAGRRR